MKIIYTFKVFTVCILFTVYIPCFSFYYISNGLNNLQYSFVGLQLRVIILCALAYLKKQYIYNIYNKFC